MKPRFLSNVVLANILITINASTRNTTEKTPQSKKFSYCCKERTLISRVDYVQLAKSQITDLVLRRVFFLVVPRITVVTLKL